MKYCLKPKAKEQLTVMGIPIILMAAILGFVWFLMWGILGYPLYNPTIVDYILVTIGYFTWAFFIYYAGSGTYYWLKDNIIKCEELK